MNGAPRVLARRFWLRLSRSEHNNTLRQKVDMSGDTIPCRMTGVTLHGVVSPEGERGG